MRRIVPLGPRGGLAGYLVTPVGGDGYSLYVTGDGHGVAGLLYGPDGVLITGGQLAAVRGENRPAGAAPSSASGAPNPAANVEGAGVRDSAVSTEVATPDMSTGVSRAALFERSASAFGFTFGERGPLVVLFGDPLCSWSRSAVARIGREAMAGKLRLYVVPVALLGVASAHRAAGIAASSNPAQAWFARDDGPAGQDARDRIARNNALFEWELYTKLTFAAGHRQKSDYAVSASSSSITSTLRRLRASSSGETPGMLTSASSSAFDGW